MTEMKMRAPRQPKPLTPIAEIIKRRNEDNKALRRRLNELGREIKVRMDEYDQIKELLGDTDRMNEPASSPANESPDDGYAPRIKCLDCGAYVDGPDPKGECPRCHASPFEGEQR